MNQPNNGVIPFLPASLEAVIAHVMVFSQADSFMPPKDEKTKPVRERRRRIDRREPVEVSYKLPQLLMACE